MIDAAPTDSIHPVFPSYFSTILKGGGQRKTILNLREASRGSARMDDRSSGDIDSNRSPKTILSHPANDQSANETSRPFSLSRTGRDRRTEREREREERDRRDVFINFYGCVLAAEAICAIRGVEGRREGAALLARLKPLLPAWHFGKGRNLGPPADRAARYYPGRGW